MRPQWKVLVLALPAAMLAACNEQPAAPAQQTHALVANFTNNPDNGNPKIFRGTTGFFAISWSDNTNGLRASHWTYQASAGCGDTPAGGYLDFQELTKLDPNDTAATRYMANAKGPVWIRVRDLNNPGDCFGDGTLVASGWGTLHYTDNDETGGGSNRNNTNAFGFTAQGTLTTVDGKQVNYSGHSNCTWRDLDPSTLRCTNQVNLH
jgi:hypothetical protein